MYTSLSHAPHTSSHPHTPHLASAIFSCSTPTLATATPPTPARRLHLHSSSNIHRLANQIGQHDGVEAVFQRAACRHRWSPATSERRIQHTLDRAFLYFWHAPAPLWLLCSLRRRSIRSDRRRGSSSSGTCSSITDRDAIGRFANILSYPWHFSYFCCWCADAHLA